MIAAMQELCSSFGTVSTPSATDDCLTIDVLQHAGINLEPVDAAA